MAGANKMQRGSRPRLGQQPRHIGRAANVEATMDENAGDAGEPICVGKQLAGVEPCSMAEVMRAEASEGHAKRGVRVTGIGLPPLLEGDDGVLPITPVFRG